MTLRGRSILLGIALVLVGAAAGVLIGFALRPAPATPAASKGLNSTAARDAKLLGLLVQSEMLSDASFPTEPKSDVDAAGRVVRVYAELSKVASGSITFDAQQYFTGAAAHREAAKDGNDDVSLDSYSRNRFVHPQTLPVAVESAVFLQVTDDERGGYGPAWAQNGQVVGFPEFVKRAQADDLLLASSYWITIGEDGVLGIEQVFAP